MIPAQRNCAYLSGVLADDPALDKDRTGRSVLVLALAFMVPDQLEPSEGLEVAVQKVEVPVDAAVIGSIDLGLGVAIEVEGQFTGGGGFLVSALHPLPGPDGGEEKQ